MSIESLVAIVSLACGISPYNIHTTRAYKLECSEKIVNCAVGLDGTIKPEAVDKCLKKDSK